MREATSTLWHREATRLRRLWEKHWPSVVPGRTEFSVPSETAVDFLRRWAEQHPHKVALAYYGCEVSYAEYDELSDRVAGWIRTRGIHPGERVAVMLDNCPQFAILMLGILKAECVHVPISPMARGAELRTMLAITTPTLLFGEPRLRTSNRKSIEASSVKTVVNVHMAALLKDVPDPSAPFDERSAPPPAGELDWTDVVAHPPVRMPGSGPDDLAALNFTGGSSGLARACEHTQRNMTFTARSSFLASGGRDSDEPGSVLNHFPMFWIAGEVFGVLAPLITGATAVIMHRWDAAAAIGLIDRYDVKHYNGTVETYTSLLDHPEFSAGAVASLDNPRCVSFGRCLDTALRERWRRATGVTLREGGYGMTESHTADTVTLGFQTNDRDLLGRGTFIGFPVPGTDLIVVDKHQVPCREGVEGRMLLRGPSVMLGYYGNPASTEEVLTDGWIDTGDRGLIESDGGIRYLGRDKDMLKVNGMAVYPREVEWILLLHPRVAEACVVGVPDAHRGQRPVAFVVGDRPEVTEETVRLWAQKNMASYKVPHIVVVEQISRSVNGKIARSRMQEFATSSLAIEKVDCESTDC